MGEKVQQWLIGSSEDRRDPFSPLGSLLLPSHLPVNTRLSSPPPFNRRSTRNRCWWWHHDHSPLTVSTTVSTIVTVRAESSDPLSLHLLAYRYHSGFLLVPCLLFRSRIVNCAPSMACCPWRAVAVPATTTTTTTTAAAEAEAEAEAVETTVLAMAVAEAVAVAVAIPRVRNGRF